MRWAVLLAVAVLLQLLCSQSAVSQSVSQSVSQPFCHYYRPLPDGLRSQLAGLRHLQALTVARIRTHARAYHVAHSHTAHWRSWSWSHAHADMYHAAATAGEFVTGAIDNKQRREIVRHACPGQGACGGMYTANTMASAIEAMGMTLPFSSCAPANTTTKLDECRQAGEAVILTGGTLTLARRPYTPPAAAYLPIRAHAPPRFLTTDDRRHLLSSRPAARLFLVPAPHTSPSLHPRQFPPSSARSGCCCKAASSPATS